MREYIEKDALYSKLYDTPCDMVEIMELVENFPAADVVSVKRGKWLSWEEQFPEKKVPKKNNIGVFCSVCHNHADNRFDYCPNCEAKTFLNAIS